MSSPSSSSSASSLSSMDSVVSTVSLVDSAATPFVMKGPINDRIETVKGQLSDCMKLSPSKDGGFTLYQGRVDVGGGKMMTVTVYFKAKELRQLKKEGGDALQEAVFERSVLTYLAWELHAPQGADSVMLLQDGTLKASKGGNEFQKYSLYGRAQNWTINPADDDDKLGEILDEIQKYIPGKYARDKAKQINDMVHPAEAETVE